MRESVLSKEPTPLPFTLTQPGLAKRSFTVKAAPERTTFQAQPDLQTQQERSGHFGHNFAKISIFATGMQPPPSIIQPKVSIRQLGEQDEQRANPSAELVMKMTKLAQGQPIQRQTGIDPVMRAALTRVFQHPEKFQSNKNLPSLPTSAHSTGSYEGSSELESQLSHSQGRERPSAEAISSLSIQPKLTVGAPGDKYEQEANQVAEQVMRMSAPPETSTVRSQAEEEEQAEIQTKPLAGTITPLVQRQEGLEGEKKIQAKCEACEREEQVQRSSSRELLDGSIQAKPDLESRLNGSKGGGSPLPDEVRVFMEPRFGADFSNVRVHTDSTAMQMNRELGAQAFTHGSDVYFGVGKSPGNNELTAHELTHVVQQTSGVQSKLLSNQVTVQHKCSNCEDDQVKLKKNSEAVIGGEAAPVELAITSTSTSTIQRADGPCADVPPRIPHQLLIRSSVHPDVREAQRRLNQFDTQDRAAGGTGINAPLLAEDCIFGQKTFNVVFAFQQKKFPNQVKEHDGKIGNNTWTELDKISGIPTPRPRPTPRPTPTSSVEAEVKTANEIRLFNLRLGISYLKALESSLINNFDRNFIELLHGTTLRAIENWLKARITDSDFTLTVGKAIILLQKNYDANSNIGFPPQSDGTCSNSPCLINGFGCTNTSAGVNVCQGWQSKGFNCKVDVLLHEFNHFIGIDGEASDSVSNPDDAFGNAHYMASFVAELNSRPANCCTSTC